MSIHSSLKVSAKDRKHRSVLKRIERLRWLSEKGKFTDEDPVFGLPKIKTLRIKLKKEKVAKEEEVPKEGAVASSDSEAKPEAGK